MKKDIEELPLSTEEAKDVLTSLAFLIGIDTNYSKDNDKKEIEKILKLIAKIKKLWFKRKPKLSNLSIIKDYDPEDKETLSKILNEVIIDEKELST